MKIVFIDYVLEPDKPGRSGLSDVVWDMAVELVNQGHDAHVVASYHTDKYPDSRVNVHNFSTPPIGYRNIVGQLWILKRAVDIVRSIQPDIVHCPEYVSSAVFATLDVRAPLVLTVPGNIFYRLRNGHGFDWSYTQVLKWAARTSAQRCDSVLAISREMQYWWQKTGSSPQRTHVIPYGVDISHFTPRPGARAALGLPADRLVLLYVGRFSPEKGLLDLLQALHQLSEQQSLDKVSVILAGKGPQFDVVRDHIEALCLGQIVQLRDWIAREELPLWYSAADALLMPSWNEPLGRVMLEAMACSTPVVASTTEGPADHVEHGQNGLLFPPHDVTALEGLLQRVVENRDVLERMRPVALQYARENVGWPAIVARIVDEIYKPLKVRAQN